MGAGPGQPLRSQPLQSQPASISRVALAQKLECMDREIALAVGPHRLRRPARTADQGRKRAERVFIAIFSVDRFAGAEVKCSVCDSDLLFRAASEVHLNARMGGIVKCPM